MFPRTYITLKVLGLFWVKRLENSSHCTFIFIFFV